jgi:hypothetical protein
MSLDPMGELVSGRSTFAPSLSRTNHALILRSEPLVRPAAFCDVALRQHR